MRIGELSRRSGLSAKTLRYYEETGLIPPPARSLNGYRDYDESVLRRIEFIRACQAMALQLDEIKEILELRESGIRPCSHVRELLAEHLSACEQRIKELREMRSALLSLLSGTAELREEDCSEDDICHIITQGLRRKAALKKRR